MTNMTWGEFKAAVEAQDVTDSMELDYIDCGFIHVKDASDLAVSITDNGVSIYD